MRGDSRGEATTLINIAVVHSLSAKPTEAFAALDQALRVSIDRGDRELQARASSTIGAVYASLGQGTVAHEFCERAIALYRAVDNEEGAIRIREAMTALDAQGKGRLHTGQTGPESAVTESKFNQAR